MAERRSNANNNGNSATLESYASDSDDTRGRGWHGNPEGHAEAGRKGGQTVSQNRAHMAAIGRKGGQSVSQNRNHMAEIGRRGGQSRGTKSADEDNASQNGRSASSRRRAA
jgi:uncharacterized protein